MGSDPAEVLENLRYYRLVLAEEGGGIEAVKVEIPVKARETALKRLYRDIHHLWQSGAVWAGQVCQRALGRGAEVPILPFGYEGGRRDSLAAGGADAYVEFFVIFQKWAKGVDYGENAFVEWTFNKSLIFNEAEQVESCQKSKGIVSDETILAHHPFVSDVQEELKRVFSDNHEKNHF